MSRTKFIWGDLPADDWPPRDGGVREAQTKGRIGINHAKTIITTGYQYKRPTLQL